MSTAEYGAEMKRLLLAVTLAVCLFGCGKPAKPAPRTVCFKHIMTNGYEIVPFIVEEHTSLVQFPDAWTPIECPPDIKVLRVSIDNDADTGLLDQLAIIQAVNAIILVLGVSIVLWLTCHK